MSIDTKTIVNSSLIQETINICDSLKTENRFRTSYQSFLLKSMLEVAIDCPEKPDGYTLDIGPRNGSKLLDKICLVSGGADSTIGWYYFDKPQGVYIDICQDYVGKEKYSIEKLKIPTYIVDCNSFLGRTNGSPWKHIIPGRNFLFLTIAAEFLKDQGKLIFSVVDGEGYESGRGDKSKKFINLWREWYYRLTDKTINVETLSHMTKGQWLKWFIDAGHDINIIRHKTVTCFSGVSTQCGKCQACLRKYLSFVNNKLDISSDFSVHPMIGASQYVDKYIKVLRTALDQDDFNHYSRQRCEEDLHAIMHSIGESKWLNNKHI